MSLSSEKVNSSILIANGYEPIPVVGKRPAAGLAWQREPITEERFADMLANSPDATGIGLRTGVLVGIDTDLTNHEHVAAVTSLAVEMLGPTPCHRVGSKGDLACYQNKSPIAKIVIKDKDHTLVEIFGTGGQFIAFGTHPTPGVGAYRWVGDGSDAAEIAELLGTPHASPLTIPLADLPEVTPAQLWAFAGRVRTLLIDLGYEDVRITGEHAATPADNAIPAEGLNSPTDIWRGTHYARVCAERGDVAVAGHNGHETAYIMAAYLVRNLALSADVAEKILLTEWYPFCDPNTDPSFIRERCQSATTSGQCKIGCDSTRPAAEAFAGFAEQIAKLAADAGAELPSELIDLWADGDYVRDAKLTRDMLPKVIADFAFDAAERLGVELAMIAMPALTVAAASLHDTYKLQPKKHDTDHLVRACMWVMMIAAPAGKKSPAIKQATAVLHHIEAQWRTEDAAAMAKFNAANDAYKAARKAAEKNPLEPGAEIPIELQEPVKPTARRIIIDNATMEGLYKPLSVNPRGMIVIKEELKEWVESFDAYSQKAGKDRAAALRLRDGGPYPVTRAADDRNFDIPNWSASVVGAIQLDVLAKMIPKLDLSSDGFFQRFQPFFGALVFDEQDRLPDALIKARYEGTIKRLIELPVPVPASAGIVTLSAGARPYWDKLKALADSISRSDAHLSALRNHAGKWGAMFAEHLLTFHAIECASDSAGRLGPEVSGETAARAYALMTEFLIPQARQVYDRFVGGVSETKEQARWVAGYILAHGLANVTARQIKKFYRSLADDAAVREVMSALQAAGWVGAPVETNKGGGSIRSPINPQVHVRFADRAVIERERRQDIREMIAADGAERKAGARED